MTGYEWRMCGNVLKFLAVSACVSATFAQGVLKWTSDEVACSGWPEVIAAFIVFVWVLPNQLVPVIDYLAKMNEEPETKQGDNDEER